MELYRSIWSTLSPFSSTSSLCLQLPPGAAANIREPEAILSPLAAVKSRASGGQSHYTPELSRYQRDLDAMKSLHETTRAFMLHRHWTHSQKGVIFLPGFISNMTFSSLDHEEKVINSSIKFIISYYACTEDFLEERIISHQVVANRRYLWHWTANFHTKWKNYNQISQGKFTGWCTTFSKLAFGLRTICRACPRTQFLRKISVITNREITFKYNHWLKK